MKRLNKVLKIIILLIIVIILSYLILNLLHYRKFTGGNKDRSKNILINYFPPKKPLEPQIDQSIIKNTPDIHFKGLMELNYPEIETTRKLPYSSSDIMAGRLLIDTPNDYIPDGYFRDDKLFIEFDEDLEFHSSRKKINYMCKSAAYNSKLLEGYSLIRIAYESKLFSADKDKDEKEKQEKAKKYRLMDKIILQIVESVLAASIPTLCLVEFDFKNKMRYQRLKYEVSSSNRSILYIEAGNPKTHQEIFNKGVTEGNKENYYKVQIEKCKDGEYVVINDSLLNSQPINGGKMSVKTGRNQRIISETSRKVPSYYFLENKMDQTITKKYCQNPKLGFKYEIVTIEEYLRRGMKNIDKISDRDMIELNTEIDTSDQDLDYPPDDVKVFYNLITLSSNNFKGWWGKEEIEEYIIGDNYLIFSEVKQYYDLFVATIYGSVEDNTIYNISEDYHKLGEWIINRYLWDIKQSLLEGKNLNNWTFNKHTVIKRLNYDKDGNHLGKAKWYEVRDYLEYLDDKGQERFINFELIYHICFLYAVTPYQMEFINSGEYEIREDLIPDLSYYDQTLSHLGLTKEQVIDFMDHHPYFRDYSYKPIIVRECTKKEIPFEFDTN